MPHFHPPSGKLRISIALEFAALFLMSAGILLPGVAPQEPASTQQSGPKPYPPAPQSQAPPPQEPQALVVQYDKAIFQEPIPKDQLTFLHQYAGAPAKKLVKDKQFQKLMHSIIPGCMFHYGRDMPLSEAIDTVLNGSALPVQIRDGRYLTVSGRSGPYLAGRGFIWIDMQDGIGVGGFYFRPVNGEPTPTVNIFSKMVKEEALGMGQLPSAFYQDFLKWTVNNRVPPVTPRYFITGSKKKIVLEHDEEYCATVGGILVAPPPACQEMDADAADTDLNTAYYLEQTHHATNSTAWMITGSDMVAWVQFRENTCRIGPDPLNCRIRMTRERTRTITNRQPVSHVAHR